MTMISDFNDDQYLQYLPPRHFGPMPDPTPWYRGSHIQVGHHPNTYDVLVYSTGMGIGPKGDDFEFEDFTEEQLAALREGIHSAIYRQEELAVDIEYTMSRIAIPFDDFNETDILAVDIDGDYLVSGEDYSIDDGDIVLLDGRTVGEGDRVGFHRLRAFALTAEDYDALKGPKGDKGDPGSSGDYPTLDDKPSINGVELNGDMTLADLDITPITNAYIDQIAV